MCPAGRTYRTSSIKMTASKHEYIHLCDGLAKQMFDFDLILMPVGRQAISSTCGSQNFEKGNQKRIIKFL